MTLRKITLETWTVCADAGLERGTISRIRNRANVLEWVLNLSLRTRSVELEEITGLRIFGAPSTRGDVILKHPENQLWRMIGVTVPDLAHRLSDPDDPAQTYAFLDWLVLEAISRLEVHFEADLSGLRNAMADFREGGFQVGAVLAERKPRGLGLTFRIEAHMDEHALSSDFVIYRDEQELHRERLMETGPDRANLKRSLRKIDFDGETVSIPGKIMTRGKEVGVGDLERDGSPQSIRPPYLYSWSRPLSEMI